MPCCENLSVLGKYLALVRVFRETKPPRGDKATKQPDGGNTTRNAEGTNPPRTLS